MDNLTFNKIMDNPIFIKTNNFKICTEMKMIKTNYFKKIIKIILMSFNKMIIIQTAFKIR